MDTIGVNLKAVLLEAFAAATELLPSTLREKFVLIGGTSMLSLGGSRKTEDVDIAVTAETLDAFQEAAILDPRFSQDVMLSWTYTGNTPETRGITVTLEFLAMGGGFVSEIRAARPIALGGFRAGLAELIVMKARTLDGRDEARDARDLRFLLEKMEGSDENFRDVELEEEDQEIMEDMVRRLGGRYPALLQTLLHRT